MFLLAHAGSFLVRNWRWSALVLGSGTAGFVFRDMVDEAWASLARFYWLFVLLLVLFIISQVLRLAILKKKQ